MKFRGHETFFIRKGWLSKGMRYVSRKPNVFTDKNDNPIDVLGIGSNMVKSLRYWLQAVGLTQENSGGRRDQHLTDFGAHGRARHAVPPSVQACVGSRHGTCLVLFFQ